MMIHDIDIILSLADSPVKKSKPSASMSLPTMKISAMPA
jgi:hypothetical protein